MKGGEVEIKDNGNLSLSTLDIQLERRIKSVLRQSDSRQTACLGKLHPLNYSEYKVIFPRKFRELRALGIFAWYCSDEFLKYEIILHLSVETKFPTNFENKNLENQLLLKLFSSSKETMLRTLLEYCDFSTRELFGSVLYDDLLRALGNLKILRKSSYVRRVVRRKGYRDKGCWRSSDRWLERFDSSFNEKQEQLEKRKLVSYLLFLLISHKLQEDEE